MSVVQPHGVRLQDRDWILLRGLFESRVMTLAHLAALHFDGKLEATKKRVQKLKAAQLIRERPRRANDPSILFLTREAFSLLSDNGHLDGLPRFSLPQLEKRAKVSDLTLRHELEVQDVKAAFVPAVNRMKGLSVAEFSTWPLLSEFTTSRSVYDLSLSGDVVVKPDGFIRVHENEADERFEHSFFLEVDRGTESQETLAQKAYCYRDYYYTGRFAERNGSTRREDFPFRVLIILKSAERRNNTAERLLAGSDPILSMTWLATRTEVVSDPLGAIWMTPKDFRDAVTGTAFDTAERSQRAGYRRQAEREALVERSVDKRKLFTDQS